MNQPGAHTKLTCDSRFRQDGHVHEAGQVGRGDVRHRLQGQVAADGRAGGAQGDPAGARGGRALHSHQGGLTPQGPQA